MNKEKINMVSECTEIYDTKDLKDWELEVYMKIPKRFRLLWLIKLDELTTTMEEIKEYEPED